SYQFYSRCLCQFYDFFFIVRHVFIAIPAAPQEKRIPLDLAIYRFKKVRHVFFYGYFSWCSFISHWVNSRIHLGLYFRLCILLDGFKDTWLHHFIRDLCDSYSVTSSSGIPRKTNFYVEYSYFFSFTSQFLFIQRLV